MADDFPHASIAEGVRFTAQIGVPNVALGLFNKRELPTRIAATVHADYLGYRLVDGMVRSYGPDPFYVRVALDEALLVHTPDDIRFVLDQSPDPFASDPEPKRKGMAAFQPDALTISRGDVWKDRRRFAEAVLDTGRPLHRLGAAFNRIAADTAQDLVAGEFGWPDFNQKCQRMTRRIVLGEAAADDTTLADMLSALMSAANGMPGEPADGYSEFIARIEGYLNFAATDCLAGLVSDAPAIADARPAGQLIHWLFAMGDTLAANLFRTLGVLASHGEILQEVYAELGGKDASSPADVGSLSYLAGCILESMRLWPTTPLFGRVATRDIEFPSGATLPAGKQVLIYNVFNHRNKHRIAYADTFSPGEWATGDAGSDWSYNFFSHGPQGCPGAGLSIFLGQALLAHLLNCGAPVVDGTRLDPSKPLPHSFDLFGYRIGIQR